MADINMVDANDSSTSPLSGESSAPPPPISRCVICDKEGVAHCTECCSVHYCSEECQKRDWPVHKVLCKTFKTIAPPKGRFLRGILFPVDREPEWVWIPYHEEDRNEESIGWYRYKWIHPDFKKMGQLIEQQSGADRQPLRIHPYSNRTLDKDILLFCQTINVTDSTNEWFKEVAGTTPGFRMGAIGNWIAVGMHDMDAEHPDFEATELSKEERRALRDPRKYDLGLDDLRYIVEFVKQQFGGGPIWSEKRPLPYSSGFGCDERFPICANCDRSRRHCTGPKSRFVRFIKPGTEEHIELQVETLQRPAPTASELLALELVERLSKVEDAGYQLQKFGTIFDHLPAQVGRNAALDASISALLGTHRLLLRGVSPCKDDDLDRYTRALILIKQDLEHFQSKTSSETVCAAALLAIYELFNSDKKQGAWIQHAGGVAALIESWGPDRIKSDFELAILVNNYGSIVSQCIILGKECFLHRPEWRPLRKKCERRWSNPTYIQVSYILASTSSLAQNVYEASGSPGVPQDRLRALRTRVHRFKDDITKFRSESGQFKQITEMASMRCEPGAPSEIYIFEDFDATYAYNFYWALVIIANKMLTRLGAATTETDREINTASVNICKSTNFMRSFGPFGVIWVLMVMTCAYGVSSPERQDWIQNELKELFGRLPMKMNPISMLVGFDTLSGGPLRKAALMSLEKRYARA
ncbi:hypothetical protein NA57DRAFT_72794 [Rhizodiscina lignyota]|uniref:MYND-type domain-containing protein n=1 Tax=Rhizodiscina lignyota TaxID=1504668 RepID=A0A9P4M854_9PEZI|nr:hypothetical protein NA57DRAFT_72794 [Rhizodiscina lignyota]